MLKSSRQQDHLVGRLVAALQATPHQPGDPGEPDVALAMPGAPPQPVKQSDERAEDERRLSIPAARDLDEGERLGAIVERGQPWTERCKHYHVVVEMHSPGETSSRC